MYEYCKYKKMPSKAELNHYFDYEDGDLIKKGGKRRKLKDTNSGYRFINYKGNSFLKV